MGSMAAPLKPWCRMSIRFAAHSSVANKDDKSSSTQADNRATLPLGRESHFMQAWLAVPNTSLLYVLLPQLGFESLMSKTALPNATLPEK
jgi:hypothetical protein